MTNMLPLLNSLNLPMLCAAVVLALACSIVWSDRKVAQRLVESMVFCRDYIAGILYPNATMVHLEDHSRETKTRNIPRRYRRNSGPFDRRTGKRIQPSKFHVIWLQIMDHIKGFWNEFLVFLGFRHRRYRILLLGAIGSRSGRSSLLAALKGLAFDPNRNPGPHFRLHTSSHVILRNIGRSSVQFDFLYYSDQETARRLLGDYFQSVHGVVYMVDLTNEEKFLLAKNELDLIIRAEDLKGKPILVLGNKIDALPAAATARDDVKRHLGLDSNENLSSRIGLFMYSVKRNIGYDDGLLWLYSRIRNRR